MDCICPDDGILQEITPGNCPFNMKQIQKLIFATKGKVIWDSEAGGGAGDGIPSATAQVDLLADWQARRTAVDNTKMVITPFIGGDPIITAGEPITEGGGDNSTLNGVIENTGTNPSDFTAIFKSISPEQEAQMKALACKDLEVYFVLEGNRIACAKNGDLLQRKGFDIQSFFFGDRNNAGFGTKDSNAISFSLPAGWSEGLVLVTPSDFNALLDL